MRLRFFCFLVVLVAAAGCSKHNTPQAAGQSPIASAQAAEPVAQPAALPPTAAQPPSAAQAASAAQGDAEPVAEAPEPPAPVREPGRTVTIPAGTRIRVRLAETLDTRRSRVGERFRAHLDEPIVAGNQVVVPKGTTFLGHVIESRPSGRLKGRAYLGVRLDSFQLHDATYQVATAASVRASKRHRNRNLAFIGGGSGGGAAIGAIAGGGVGALIGAGAGAAAGTTTAFITGRKQVTLPVETPLVFTLHQPVRIRG